MDKRLLFHLIVRPGKVYTKHVALRDRDWTEDRPQILDVFDPFTPVDISLASPSTVRFFARHASADQPWVPDADTAIHVVDVSGMRPSNFEQSCVCALSLRFKRTIVSVRYGTRLMCSVHYPYKPIELSDDPEMEVVLLVHSGPTRRAAWPSTAKPNRPLQTVIEQTLGLLRRSMNLRVTVVGRENWDVAWFDRDSSNWPLPEAWDALSVADLWDLCAGWYEVDTSRIDFVSLADFRSREPETFRLCTEL